MSEWTIYTGNVGMISLINSILHADDVFTYCVLNALVLIFLWCASVHVMQGLSGLQSMLRKDQSFRGAMRPVRLVMTAANAKTGALFCLVECEEEADVCKSMDQDVVLLQMHCTGKAHGIIKLNMSAEDQAKGTFQDGGVLVEGEQVEKFT